MISGVRREENLGRFALWRSDKTFFYTELSGFDIIQQVQEFPLKTCFVQQSQEID